MLKSPAKTHHLHWLWLSVAIVIFDQWSKWFASHTLTFNQAIEVNRFFNWFLDFNKGAAFGLLGKSHGWQEWLFSGIAIVVSVLILWALKRGAVESRLQAAGLACILGGAIGNLIDRFWHHYVIDFIAWHVGSHYWPTFNIADSAVCIGAALFILGSTHDKKQQ